MVQRLIVFVFLLSSQSAHATNWIDESQSIFFPSGEGKNLELYQQFPATWWNFITVEKVDSDEQWNRLQAFCKDLRDETQDKRAEIFCPDHSLPYRKVLEDWSKDIFLRKPSPDEKNIILSLNETLAKASLPIDRAMLEYLRKDPFGSYQDYLNLSLEQSIFKLTPKNGVLYDEETKRVALPVKFGFPPSHSQDTSSFTNEIPSLCKKHSNCSNIGFVGPHFATQMNRGRIESDLDRASYLGLAMLLVFITFLITLKMYRYAFLIPPIVLGVALAAYITVLVYGSLHGLSLAFGVGIIGLAMDYGLHGIFSKESNYVWRANAIGLVTTSVVLLVVATSSIPLLQQLCFFSVVGLLIAYLINYFLQKNFKRTFRCKPLNLRLKTNKILSATAGALILLGLLAWPLASFNLGTEQFDYQTLKSKKLTEWIIGNIKATDVLFEISPQDRVFRETSEEKIFSDRQNIKLENAATYLPSLPTQLENLKTWKSSFCGAKNNFLSAQHKSFFAPFISEATCYPQKLEGSLIPSYLAHLNFNDHWLSLWLPETEEQEQKILKSFPEVRSARKSIQLFPDTLTNELKWMAPLALGLVFLILLIYYRSILLSTVSLVPFVAGVGLVLLAHLLGMTLSFVSLVALLMLAGFSVDYGIFITRLFEEGRQEREHGVLTSVLLAVVTNLCGFIPLVFCGHKVLAHLGQTLTLGSIGALIGGFWGIPLFLNWYQKRNT